MASADSITVKVPGHEIGGNGRSKYVLYRVEATRGSESFVALSRYSNFIKLDEDVRKAYKGNHLASNIPQLPPKQAKFIVNHMDPEFIEERRDDLERYLHVLSRIPNMNKVAAFVEFVEGKQAGQQTATAAPTESAE